MVEGLPFTVQIYSNRSYSNRSGWNYSYEVMDYGIRGFGQRSMETALSDAIDGIKYFVFKIVE